VMRTFHQHQHHSGGVASSLCMAGMPLLLGVQARRKYCPEVDCSLLKPCPPFLQGHQRALDKRQFSERQLDWFVLIVCYLPAVRLILVLEMSPDVLSR